MSSQVSGVRNPFELLDESDGGNMEASVSLSETPQTVPEAVRHPLRLTPVPRPHLFPAGARVLFIRRPFNIIIR